jgi:hypothetical protein
MMMMDELFADQPDCWGLRGDPYVWKALQERLSGLPVPDEEQALDDLLVEAFNAVVGVDLRNESVGGWGVYREEFAHGGMSSGHVSLKAWRDRLIPLLVSRRRA